jgi:hypothetical protein
MSNFLLFQGSIGDGLTIMPKGGASAEIKNHATRADKLAAVGNVQDDYLQI